MHVALILILILFANTGNAQPTAAAAVNSASFARSDLPNGSLAQGSIFTVFGSNMGPAALAQSTSFPLPTDLAGTSVKVTVGGTSIFQSKNEPEIGQDGKGSSAGRESPF